MKVLLDAKVDLGCIAVALAEVQSLGRLGVGGLGFGDLIMQGGEREQNQSHEARRIGAARQAQRLLEVTLRTLIGALPLVGETQRDQTSDGKRFYAVGAGGFQSLAGVLLAQRGVARGVRVNAELQFGADLLVDVARQVRGLQCPAEEASSGFELSARSCRCPPLERNLGEGLCEWANSVFSTILPAVATAEQPAFERLDVPPEKKGSPGEVLRLSHGAEIERDELETTDAEAIAAIIRAQIDSGKRTAGDFLILTRRKKGRLEPYAAALESARVPYEVSGSGSLLESPSVQAMAALLYALTHPDDGVALVGALRGPCFGLSDPGCVRLQEIRWRIQSERAGGTLRSRVPPRPPWSNCASGGS